MPAVQRGRGDRPPARACGPARTSTSASPTTPGTWCARARQLLGDQPDRPDDRATVLVIDDSVTFREQLRELLEPEGYAVLTAASRRGGAAGGRRPPAAGGDRRRRAARHRRRHGDPPGPARRRAARRAVPAADRRPTTTPPRSRCSTPAPTRSSARRKTWRWCWRSSPRCCGRAPSSCPIDPAGSLHGPSKVLAVDTRPGPIWRSWRVALRADGYDVVPAASAEEALELLAAQPVDCILLDLRRPGRGRETCRRIKAAPRIGDIPLVMTGSQDDVRAGLPGRRRRRLRAVRQTGRRCCARTCVRRSAASSRRTRTGASARS